MNNPTLSLGYYGRLFDRYAAPHLPRIDGYTGRLKDFVCRNAEILIPWTSAQIGKDEFVNEDVFPFADMANYVSGQLVEIDGRLLIKAFHYDYLRANIDVEEFPGELAEAMITIVGAHVVRAADAVATGLANQSIFPRIDVTAHYRKTPVLKMCQMVHEKIRPLLEDDMLRIEKEGMASANRHLNKRVAHPETGH